MGNQDLQLEKKCESCDTTVPLPVRPGPRVHMLAAAERRGRFLCGQCNSVVRTKAHEARHVDLRRRQKAEAAQRWRDKATREKTAELNRKYRYGLTPEQFDEMCKRDPGCAICGREDKPLVIDHDHATEHVRGRLCCGCNTALGKFGDSVTRLKTAIKYLEERTC